MGLNISPTFNILGEHAIQQALANGGLGKLAAIAFGSGQYEPTGTETALKNEVVRAQIETVVDMGRHIEVSATLIAPEDFAIGEVAFLLEDDTPFAVWSEDPARQYPKLDMATGEQIVESGVPQTRAGRSLATVSEGTEIPFRYIVDIGADNVGRLTVLAQPLNEAYAILDAKVDGLATYQDAVLQFGGVGDGVTDDTQAVLDADAYCAANGRRLVLTRRYAVRPVALQSEVHCEFDGAFVPYAGIAWLGEFIVTLQADKQNHGDLRSKGNELGSSGIKIEGDDCSAEDFFLDGFCAREAGATYYGLAISGARFTQRGRTWGQGFSRLAAVGDVWPQGVATWNGSDNTRLGPLVFRDCVSGFVPGPQSGSFTVASIEGDNLSDNLAYIAGGTGTIGPITANNVEEPLVHKGGYLSVGHIACTGHAIRVVGLDRATGVLDVASISVGPSPDGETPKQIWGLRSGNAGHSCPGIRIGPCQGVFAGFSVWQAYDGNGSVSEVEIGQMKLTMNFDDNADDDPSYFMESSGVDGIKIARSSVQVVDRTGASTAIFRLQLPTLTKRSQIDGLMVECVLQSGLPGAHVFRGNNAAQEHMRVVDGVWHDQNPSPVLREVAFGPPGSINASPNGGFWHVGTTLIDKTPTPTSSFFQCTATGTAPGNFRTVQ